MSNHDVSMVLTPLLLNCRSMFAPRRLFYSETLHRSYGKLSPHETEHERCCIPSA